MVKGSKTHTVREECAGAVCEPLCRSWRSARDAEVVREHAAFDGDGDAEKREPRKDVYDVVVSEVNARERNGDHERRDEVAKPFDVLERVIEKQKAHARVQAREAITRDTRAIHELLFDEAEIVKIEVDGVRSREDRALRRHQRVKHITDGEREGRGERDLAKGLWITLGADRKVCTKYTQRPAILRAGPK